MEPRKAYRREADPAVREPADILKKIVAAKRREVERLKREAPVSKLEERIAAQAEPLNLAGALTGDRVRVIGEVKRASPTAGLLLRDFEPGSLATIYADNGAAAISVLTNVDHFQGSIQHLKAVHDVANPRGVPVLRKDFIFDRYQVNESRAYGADAILLIVAILAPQTLRDLMELSREYWMQCLVEVHDEEELKIALDAGAEIVGVNNRDLRTFKTEIGVTERLVPLIPSDRIIVSESGISAREHVERVARAGANAVLVGEALLTAEDPGMKLRELV
jgi:indole-3-glycerol phosphate synthase